MGIVVTREARGRGLAVVKSGRYPGRRRVAGVTGVGCHKVGAGLALGDRIVVARQAGTIDLRMVNAGGRLPNHDGVAAVAGVGGLDVSGGLAGRICIVVAGEAIAAEVRVVGPAVGRYPARCRMAVGAAG